MSRIGKQPIIIPDNIEVKIDNQEIKIKGPKGELVQFVPFEIGLSFNEISKDGESHKEIRVKIQKKTKNSSALWGLARALIANMVKGAVDGFEKKLEISGVGYRAVLEGKNLVLNLGLSHPIVVEPPQGIEFSVEKNIISVMGIDKQLVGQIAAKIRSYKKPEPYKGKGIRYIDEIIRRKAGKKAAGAE